MNTHKQSGMQNTASSLSRELDCDHWSQLFEFLCKYHIFPLLGSLFGVMLKRTLSTFHDNML